MKLAALGACWLDLVDLLGVDVADRDDVDFGVLLKLGHVVAAALADADGAELDPVVGSEDAFIGERGEGGCATEEIAAIGH